MKQHRLRKPHGLKRTGRSATKTSEIAPLNIEEMEMNVNETKHGIEVSLDVYKDETREPPQTPREPVISMKEQIRQRQRVHKNQFSLAFPALDLKTKPDVSLDSWRPKDHRIPLLGISAVEAAYEDVLSLLQHSRVADEYSSVHQELQLITSEIGALEKDRTWLESTLGRMTNSSMNFSPTKTTSSADWDTRKLLDSASIGNKERLLLQRKRGNCLTFRFQNLRARDIFMTKSGAKLAQLRNNKRRSPGDTVTLTPNTCKPGGAAAGVRHLTLMSNNNDSHSAFFFSRDSGKSQTWGRLPPKLFRRIKGASSDSGQDISDIVYLSTGPHGCYYAEFRSGECWWGNAVDDRDFHSIMQSWDVYRVVFGPIDAFEDERGNRKMTNSWIILGRDGRAAWKNLPSRLHHRLESRLANWAAPEEVALGAGDSYFIRFLDGTVDYCLPAEVARVCEHVERHGGSITDIALHPEISHDFVIRHTELR